MLQRSIKKEEVLVVGDVVFYAFWVDV